MPEQRDAWLQAYDDAEKLGQEIMDKISQYHQEMMSKLSSTASLSTGIRTLQKKFLASTATLKQQLTRSASQGTISSAETDRRQALLDNLISTGKRLDQAFAAKSPGSFNRSSLLGGSEALTSSTANSNPWLLGEESDTSRGVATSDIRAQHQLVLQEQDRGLDALSKAVGRQRDMAINIAAEVDIHNDILGEISEEMERADVRLARENRNIKVILVKSRTHWGLWVLIVLLLISILVVACVPK